MVAALILSPSFNSNVETRDQILDKLPLDAQRAVLHQVHQASVAFRDKVDQALADYADDEEKDVGSLSWGPPWSVWTWPYQTETQSAMDSIRSWLGFGCSK